MKLQLSQADRIKLNLRCIHANECSCNEYITWNEKHSPLFNVLRVSCIFKPTGLRAPDWLHLFLGGKLKGRLRLVPSYGSWVFSDRFTLLHVKLLFLWYEDILFNRFAGYYLNTFTDLDSPRRFRCFYYLSRYFAFLYSQRVRFIISVKIRKYNPTCTCILTCEHTLAVTDTEIQTHGHIHIHVTYMNIYTNIHLCFCFNYRTLR